MSRQGPEIRAASGDQFISSAVKCRTGSYSSRLLDVRVCLRKSANCAAMLCFSWLDRTVIISILRQVYHPNPMSGPQIHPHRRSKPFSRSFKMERVVQILTSAASLSVSALWSSSVMPRSGKKRSGLVSVFLGATLQHPLATSWALYETPLRHFGPLLILSLCQLSRSLQGYAGTLRSLGVICNTNYKRL